MKTSDQCLSRFIVAAGLFCSVASAFAQTDASRNGGARQLDANKDKLISREEAKASPRLLQSFDKIDANKDGQLSRNEMQKFRQSNHPDQDRDGNISKSEASSKPHLAKNFDKIDTNRDGVLTPSERQTWMNTQRSQRAR